MQKRKFKPRAPYVDDIFARLKNGPASTKELAEIANLNQADMASRLAIMRRRGHLQRDLQERPMDKRGGSPIISIWRLAS